MKVTEWAYEYIIGFLAEDKAEGQAFLNKFSYFQGEDENSLDRFKLVPVGQPDAEPVVFATVCPCKKDFYDFVQAVKEGADFSDARYDYAKAKGVVSEQFDSIISKIHFLQFRNMRDLTTNEPIPRPFTLDEYLAVKGYEVKSND